MAIRETYQYPALREIIDGNGNGIGNIDGPKIKRLGTRSKVGRGKDVDREVAEEVEAIYGSFAGNSVEDLQYRWTMSVWERRELKAQSVHQ